jgi:hypothetical protein
MRDPAKTQKMLLLLEEMYGREKLAPNFDDKEFCCLTCRQPFSREDCKIHKMGSMVKISKCPFCWSDMVVRKIDSDWAKAHKYDVPIEAAILGPKRSKFAGLAEKKMILSGKIKRKKA